MQLVYQTIANSVVMSCFFVLLAVGLTLVFGVMKTANYAHGEFYMVGAYAVWLLYARAGWPFFVAVAAAVLIVGLLGLITERAVFRPVRGNILSGFIISVGLVFILQVLVARIWGVGLAKEVPPALPGALIIGGVTISWQRVIIIPFAILVMALLYLFLNRTRLGQGLRASALDSEAASLHGIGTNTSAFMALGIGSAMAGLSGALMAPIMAVTPYMGHLIIMMCFVIIIIGGAGSLKGAILVAILFGFLFTIITTFLDSVIAMIAACVAMLIVLAIKPGGMMGYEEE